jgi:hypothetical protein
MPKKNLVDQKLKRDLSISLRELEPLLEAGGDRAEMKFMECCRALWKADGVELIEPFIEALFNKLPERSRSILFQRILTIVYLAQDGERPPAVKPPNRSRTIHSSTRADEC